MKIFALDPGFKVSQYNILPPRLPKGYLGILSEDVIIHNSPSVSQIGGKVETNFDIYVTDKPTNENKVQSPNLVVSVPRFKKSVQQSLLQRWSAGMPSNRKFRLVKTWVENDINEIGLTCPNTFFMKNENAARGLNQFLLTVKPGHTHLQAYNAFVNVFRSTADGDFDNFHIDLPEVQATLLGSVSTNNLRGDYLIQEVLDITKEYRLFTDINGNIVYSQERERLPCNVSGLNRASSKQPDSEHNPHLTDLYFKKYIIPGLKHLKRGKLFTMHSLDIALLSDGTWTILEFQNETGWNSVPMVLMTQWLVQFLEDCIQLEKKGVLEV